MLKRLSVIIIAVAALSGAVAAFLYLSAPSRQIDLAGLAGDAERGAYVLRLGGCVTCHTDGEDGAFLAGGAAIKTPFGNYFPPNITSDEEYGIGAWTLDEFAEALINGRSPEGRHYAPTFPFTSYTKMDLQDVADLYAHLMTTEAVAQPDVDHELALPARLPLAMGIWKALGFDPGPFSQDPNKSAEWNRGAYIVNGPGHCGECHTPRDGLGRLSSEEALGGTTLMPSKEKVPPITTEALQERGWSKGGLVLGFKFGFMPDGDVMGGSMGEVVRDDLAHLTQDDLNAVATYLLDE